MLAEEDARILFVDSHVLVEEVTYWFKFLPEVEANVLTITWPNYERHLSSVMALTWNKEHVRLLKGQTLLSLP